MLRGRLTTYLNNEFDGDALNFSIATDNKIADLWRPLQPHHNVFELNKPGKISSNILMPKPVVSTMSNFLDGD